MKSQSNEYPSVIQKLDNNTFAFNYNIVESKDEEDNITYTYDQVIVNSSSVDKDDIIRNTIIENFDINQQLKLVNDYFAYSMGVLSDEKYATRYKDFLEFRAAIKEKILDIIIL